MFFMKKLYVFPGNIRQDILEIGANQIPYMRTSEFSKINLESEEMLLYLVGCKNGKTIIYTGSGTGAMDAIVTNYVSTKRKVFIIDAGSFGHRWAELCDYYGIANYVYKVNFSENIDYEHLEKVIKKEKPDIFLCQHHETSSGELFDIKEYSKICHKYNLSLVVDVISTFLAEELDMDSLDIDICVTSTQKGLNIPPGLSIIFISSRLINYDFNHRGFYFDFKSNLENLKRGQTPYSPATTIFLQLNKRLHQIMLEGKENLIARVHDRASYFRNLCVRNNWKIPTQNPSYAITGFFVNNNKNMIFRELIDNYNTYIMPGQKEGFFRVSHMGEQDKEDLDLLAKNIQEIESYEKH